MTQVVQAQRGEMFAGYNRLEVMSCVDCGVLFAAPEEMFAALRKSGRTFYCPNGHSMSWNETEADRLRKKLRAERERAEREAARAGRLAHERDQLKASERAQRAAKTRAQRERDRERKRVGNGVCPCCSRTFANLQRHMASKHPEHAHPAAS